MTNFLYANQYFNEHGRKTVFNYLFNPTKKKKSKTFKLCNQFSSV